MKAVRIVIVNTKTPGLVIDCLHSLAPEIPREQDCRVVVADNASPDGSTEKIRAVIQHEGWDWAEVQQLDRNRGFAVANNAAIRPLLDGARPPDYIFLLNPDTLVRPGAVRVLVQFLDDHPAVGIVGSLMISAAGTPQASAFRFPGVASELDRGARLGLLSKSLRRWNVVAPISGEAQSTDWVCGAGMMVRREVFDKIGLLDETFFVYYEETEFCLRARRAGWSCWLVPQSVVVHLEGQTTSVGAHKSAPKRLPAYWFASRRHYFCKSHGMLYCLGADVAWTLGHVSWRLRNLIQRKPCPDPPHLLADFIRYNFLQPLVGKLPPFRHGRTPSQ